MEKTLPTLQSLLEERLREIYGDRLRYARIDNALKHPSREGRYVVTYSLSLVGQPPVLRAKTVLDLSTGELLAYDPALP